SYLTSQQRGEAPAPPQPEGLCGFWPGALLLVGQRPQRVCSLLAPHTQPKFAAALLYEPHTWGPRNRFRAEYALCKMECRRVEKGGTILRSRKPPQIDQGSTLCLLGLAAQRRCIEEARL